MPKNKSTQKYFMDDPNLLINIQKKKYVRRITIKFNQIKKTIYGEKD